jgi:hypothetical protein
VRGVRTESPRGGGDTDAISTVRARSSISWPELDLLRSNTRSKESKHRRVTKREASLFFRGTD